VPLALEVSQFVRDLESQVESHHLRPVLFDHVR
jgi:hypothetical protein